MLTEQQHRFFDAFGYLHFKQVFSPVEISDLTREADRIWKEDAAQHPEQTHQSMSGFIEKSPLLGKCLLEGSAGLFPFPIG